MMDATHELQTLDDLLAVIRTATMRPGYRRRMLSGLDMPGGVTMLRLLRAVEDLSANGSPSIKDVAERLAVEHSTASRSVEAAVQADLLSRQPCKDDQRRTRLELTAHGREVMTTASRRRRHLLAEVTDGWPDGDIARLIQLLEALRVGFDRLEQSPLLGRDVVHATAR